MRDLDTLAERVGVRVSDLARYLLRYAVDQANDGALTIPTRPARMTIDDPRARE